MAGQIKKITVNGETYEIGGGISAPISTTYSELKSLKESSGLAIGQKYRITDFVSSFGQSGITSANHPFDLIIEANANNAFSETAIAIQHVGDDYFSNSNLSAWQVSYCFDNDTTRFPQASSSGKGFIYYLKDEYGNEACYDFKNALFQLTNSDYDFITDTVNAYTFSTYISSMTDMLDASLNANSVNVSNNSIKEFNLACFIVKKPTILVDNIKNNTVLSGEVVIYSTASTGLMLLSNTFSGYIAAKISSMLRDSNIYAGSNSKLYTDSNIRNSDISFVSESSIECTSSKIEYSKVTFNGKLNLTLSSSNLNNDTLVFISSGTSETTCTISSQTLGAKNIKISQDGSYKVIDPFA